MKAFAYAATNLRPLRQGLFFDRDKLQEAAPILWQDVDEAANIMGGMLNDYSADFDGERHTWKKVGIDDLSKLLHAAANGRR